MPRMTETQRRVTETRIQAAGGQEQAGIGQFLGAGQQSLGAAPQTGDILDILRGGPEADIARIRDATFSGISQGAQPQITQALRFARESAVARGVSGSSIDAALQAQGTVGILSPLLQQAQSQFAGLLPTALNQRRMDAQSQLQLRNQAFNELGAGLSRGLQERSQNRTTTQRDFKKKQGLFGKILGTGLGLFTGGLAGSLGERVGNALFSGGSGRGPSFNAIESAITPREQFQSLQFAPAGISGDFQRAAPVALNTGTQRRPSQGG